MYMRTSGIERFLNVPKLSDKLQDVSKKYMERPNAHPNGIARIFVTAAIKNGIKRRLKRPTLKTYRPGFDINSSNS